jgi:hypothetical protein
MNSAREKRKYRRYSSEELLNVTVNGVPFLHAALLSWTGGSLRRKPGDLGNIVKIPQLGTRIRFYCAAKFLLDTIAQLSQIYA